MLPKSSTCARNFRNSSLENKGSPMFELKPDCELEGKLHSGRRVFLGSAAAAVAGLILWQWRKPRVLEAASPLAQSKEITIVLFSDSGQRQRQVRSAKVVKTMDEWRKQLSPNTFDITRNADTEIAFSGKYWN